MTNSYIRYHVALSQDGKEVATFNSLTLELSTRKIDNLNEPQFVYEPFQNASSAIFNNVTWSLSISNKLPNGEILIALSCFDKDDHLIAEDKNSLEPSAFLRSRSRFVSTSQSDDMFELEKGETKSKSKGYDSTTWVFSTLNKKRIRTAIDGLGGVVKFLDSPENSSLIIIHHYGITKTKITFGSSNKKFWNKFWNKDSLSNNTIEFHFPLSISKYIGASKEDSPRLKDLCKHVKKRYIFARNYKSLGKLKILECFDLGRPNDGKLVKSFQTDHYYNQKIVATNSNKFNMIIEISKNEKLLAYYNERSRNIITLYLMENSLKIYSKEFTDIQRIIHIHFICNDEKLLIIGEQVIEEGQKAEHSKEIETEKSTEIIPVFVVWDLFSSNPEEDSVKMCLVTQDPLNLLNAFKHNHQHASSNGIIIYVNYENGTINSLLDQEYLIDILNPPKNNSLKLLSPDIIQEINLDRNFKYHKIYHLDNDEIDDYKTNEEVIFEPWINRKSYPKVLTFLDDDKSILLIIGDHSVQVWKIEVSKGMIRPLNLEYVWMNRKKIEIQSLLIGKNEFLLEFTLYAEDSEEDNLLEIVNEKEDLSIKLHWPHNLILRDACVALEYIHNRLINEPIDPISPKRGILLNEFRVQTQKIVKNFINNQPIVFKFTDIRYDIMANLIRGDCVSLIKKILFNKTENFTSTTNLKAMSAKMRDHLHFPRLYSWDSDLPKKNDLDVAIETIAGVHRKETLIVGYLLEYYSDNAMKDNGWMITISQALPLLFDRHLDYYVRELFYKPCFGTKQAHVDKSLICPHELMKGQLKDVHAIYIQQGLIRKPKFKNSLYKDNLANTKEYMKQRIISASRHDSFNTTKLRVVPLPNFFDSGPNSPQKKNSDYFICRLLKFFFLPCKYTSGHMKHSPFLRVLTHDKGTTIFSSPSLSALIDYKWHKTQLYFLRHFLIYILFAIIFGFITNIVYFGDWKPHYSREVNLTTQAIFFFIGYYLLAVRIVRFKHNGVKRSASLYHFFHYASIIMPISLVIYLNIKYSIMDESMLRKYTISTAVATFVMWTEFLLSLRYFSGPANYINISLNILREAFNFFIFMFIFVVAIGHSMYILLRSPDSINLYPNGQNFAIYNNSDPSVNLYPNASINETFDVNNVSDNYFSDFFQSIVAVYFWINGRWDQVEQWDFLPVQILSFVASIILITVMQNMLIALMASVFDEASALGKQAALMFRAELICDYEALAKISFHERDGREHEDKSTPTNLYYIAKVNEVKRWEDEGKKYMMNNIVLVDRFDYLTDEEEDNDDVDDNDYENDETTWGMEKDYSLDSVSVNRMNRVSRVLISNDDKIESKIEKLEQKVKELQDGMQSKMKVLDNKLEKVLELLKA